MHKNVFINIGKMTTSYFQDAGNFREMPDYYSQCYKISKSPELSPLDITIKRKRKKWYRISDFQFQIHKKFCSFFDKFIMKIIKGSQMAPLYKICYLKPTFFNE